MNIVRTLVSLCLSLSLVGCSSVQIVKNGDNINLAKLQKNSSAYIIVAKNGSHQGKVYDGTGRIVTEIIFSELSKHLEFVKTSVFVKDFKEGLDKARKQGFTYVIYPEILDWQYTGGIVWTPSPTQRAELKISVFNTQTGNLIDSVVIKVNGLSPWIWAVDAPTHTFLYKPIEQYISSLF
ncbi:MAG: hypothetical protein COX41_02920 [Candidatus Omnitrophica bacterium CG23_combo_of_CG06-09_8_20_14_all_41_10]|uniref:DUF4823 domain-containing protein n=1 Tax=Candidatus Sherwoodlollariibacterium unditelluris TaxID=1974757 RepID=A0A2G9YJK9_9BACT|nr:MAG: hypothetical protein COX41_02920 [Candidatus Omnitrophica bacterium CG23_combo_of_CG06-09_8_20_14_all_41_10]